MGLIVGFFVIKSKYQEAKIEDLEYENERFEKKDTIEEAIEVAEAQAEKDEITAKAFIDASDWRDELRK